MRAIHWAPVGLFCLLLAGCAPQALPATGEAPAATQSETGTTTPTPAPTVTVRPTLAATATATAAPAETGPLQAGKQPVRALTVAPGGSLYYGVLADGLARSGDGGLTWQRVSEQILPAAPLVLDREARVLLAGAPLSCFRGDGDLALRRSGDGGVTWQKVAGGEGIQPVAGRPDDEQVVYGVSCAGLHVSRDGGRTWQETASSLGWTISALLPAGHGGLQLLAVLTSEGGVSRLAWFDEQGRLSQGPSEEFSFWGTAALATDGEYLFAGTAAGVWRSADGARWMLYRDGLSDVVLEADPLQEPVPQEAFDRGFGLFALAVDPADPRRLALGTIRGVYLSSDRGEHWQPAPGAEAVAGLRISAVTWDPQEKEVLYATTPQGVWRIVMRDP